MQVYKIQIEKTKHGYLAISKDFDIAIDADTLDHALKSIKAEIEKIGSAILNAGKFLPATGDTELQVEAGETATYVEVDIYRKFQEDNTNAVRKNISLPGWMDVRLRAYGVDASKLFQDAAMKYIQEREAGSYQPINSLEALKNNVDPQILSAYVKEYINNNLQ